jgi:REP element-mobilizing transposase RayT
VADAANVGCPAEHILDAGSVDNEGLSVETERVTRGSLPHWYKPGHPHFITYRLAGTIPAPKLNDWKARRAELLTRDPPPGVDRATYCDRINKQFFAEYDRHLDTATGVRWLADPQVAAIVRENLLHHHGSKYELLAWCVMSNHVHVVLQPFENAVDAGNRRTDAGSVGNDDNVSDEVEDSRSPLSSIMHSLKSFTANQANRILNRTGPFWQRESYDHWIRDMAELERIVAYVLHNPVTAGLCSQPHLWPFSSAHDRFQLDGSTCGLIGQLRDNWRTPPN